MSMIMALDPFVFYHEPFSPHCTGDAVDEREYVSMTMERGQAIAFTSELLHAGGPNMLEEDLYHLFAYIVCNEADYPTNKVFPNTPSRMVQKSQAPLGTWAHGHVEVSGRAWRTTTKR
jgi:hypothetical protein